MAAARTAVSPAECTLATLGSFEWRIRGQAVPNPATQKARALLSYVVLHRRTNVARERLIEIFWPDAEPERARDSLNTALHSIRRGLRAAGADPNAYVYANKSIVRWEAQVDLDVDLIEDALRSDDAAIARDALAHYRGDFLEGDYDDWTVAERERIAERYEQLLARTVRSTGEPDAAKKLLARNPYDEDAYTALVDAELAAGRYLSAVQIVRQCYEAFTEIGVQPSEHFAKKFKGIEQRAAQTATAIDVPFVGRNAELTELLDSIEGSRSDEACVVLLEGEPGMGKSALMERALRHAVEAGRRVISVRAAGDDSRAFGIWPELYALLAGGEFADFLARVSGNAAAELGPAIAANLPQSAVLAIDDAQYFTGDALEVLTALLKTVAARRTHRAIVSTRPEGAALLSERLRETQYALLRLSPLTDDDVRTAVALAGIDLGPATSDLLVSRARGHPLYVKGLLEQLVRSAALRRDGKRWQLARPEADLQWPPSLRRLIENRIRARGSDAVAVACALAVEPSACAAEVCAATGLTELAVLDALDDLLRYHVIAEPASGPRAFVFTHDLLEETARNLLPSARRSQLHGAFAQILSASAVRGREVRRAMHLEAAAMYEESAQAFLIAAQESAESQAAYATLERTDGGLRCLDRLASASHLLPLYSKLHQARSFARRLLWEVDACALEAEKAVEYARASEDPLCLVQALNVLQSAINIGNMDRARQLRIVRELASLGERLNDESLVVKSAIDEGHAYRITYAALEAEEHTRRAFAVARGSGRPELIAKAAIQLLSLQACWWRFDGAAEVVAALKEIEPRLSWPFRTHASLALALLWSEGDRFDLAATELHSVDAILAQALLKQTTSQPYVPRPEIAIRLDYFAGSLAARRGTWTDGLAHLERHLPMYEPLLNEARYRDLFTFARIDLLLGRNAAGDFEAARALFEETADAWEPETGFQPCHTPAVTRARIHARENRADAPARLAEALDFLDAEAARWPYGVDVAFALLADAAAGFEDSAPAQRAAESAARYRAQRLAAAADLVSV